MSDFNDLIKGFYTAARRDKRLDVAHPDEEQLFDYAAGLLKQGAREEVEQHLADCPYCVDLLVQQKAALRSAAQIEGREAGGQAKRDLTRVFGLGNWGETVFGLGSGIAQIVKTTGVPAPEILSASRGTSSFLFDSSGSVDHYLGDYRITISVERYGTEQSVHVTVVDPEADEFPDHIQVVLENSHMKTAVTREGEVSFPEVPAGRHRLRFLENEQELGKIFVELRQLAVAECLAEARVALKQGAYSRAEDLVATALSREESQEGLELRTILELLKEIYPQGFQDDLTARGLEERTERMLDRSLGDLDTLVSKIQGSNQLLAQAIHAIEHVKVGERESALRLFRNLRQQLPDSVVGHLGVGLSLQMGRDLTQLSSNEVDEVLGCFERVLSVQPETPEFQEHRRRARQAKNHEEVPPPTSDLEQRTLLRLTHELTALGKRTHESAAGDFETVENRLKIFLKELENIKARETLTEIEKVSEPELHRRSSNYQLEITGRVKSLKALLWEEYRETESRLMADIGGEESWQKLGTAGLYLLTGEFVFDMLKMAHTDDYSPASLGFVKALETFLNQRIVWHTESWLGCPPKDIRKKLQQDFKKAEKGRSTPILLQALEQSSVARGYALSCGELAGVFREIKTRNKDWRAYHLLRKFLSAKSDRFLQQSFYDLLDQVSNYRNGAVHTKALNFQAMERCRNLILPEIKFLLSIL